MTPLRCTLEIALGHGESTVVDVQAGMKIGRGDDCHVQVPDGAVSSVHAEIGVEQSTLTLKDLGSQNGVLLASGHRLTNGEQVILERGLAFRMGETQFVVLSAPDPAPARASSSPRGAASSDLPGRTVPVGEESLSTMGLFAGDQAPHLEDSFEATLSTSGASGILDASRALELAHPRLVIFDDPESRRGARVHVLSQPSVVVGRAKTVDVRLSNPMVSAEHARLSYVAAIEEFQVEDLGSANGSAAGRAVLVPGAPRQIEADTHLRFASTGVMFRMDATLDGRILDHSYDLAIALHMRRQRKLRPWDLRKGLNGAKKSGGALGDLLLQSHSVNPDEWCAAAAELRRNQSGDWEAPSSYMRSLIAWFAVAVLIASAVLLRRAGVW